MIKLANRYIDVLIMNTIHKTNRFNLPLLDERPIFTSSELIEGERFTLMISALLSQKESKVRIVAKAEPKAPALTAPSDNGEVKALAEDICYEAPRDKCLTSEPQVKLEVFILC